MLKIELPREAMFSVDSKTGKKIPSETSTLITIRDHNLDGIPDDFSLPGGFYNQELTNDGFIKF